MLNVEIGNGEVKDASFSFIKNIEDADHYLSVHEAAELLNRPDLDDEETLRRDIAVLWERWAMIFGRQQIRQTDSPKVFYAGWNGLCGQL